MLVARTPAPNLVIEVRKELLAIILGAAKELGIVFQY